MIDISLYDHVKITAAIGSCIYEYMKENNETDYEKYFINKQKNSIKRKHFCFIAWIYQEFRILSIRSIIKVH